MNGGELDYLYWDPEMEPRVGLGTDADEDEEGSPERGVEAEVVPGSSTEVGNFLGEEEYEVQPETDNQPETESDADGDDLDHIRDDSGARRYQTYVSVIRIALRPTRSLTCAPNPCAPIAEKNRHLSDLNLSECG